MAFYYCLFYFFFATHLKAINIIKRVEMSIFEDEKAQTFHWAAELKMSKMVKKKKSSPQQKANKASIKRDLTVKFIAEFSTRNLAQVSTKAENKSTSSEKYVSISLLLMWLIFVNISFARVWDILGSSRHCFQFSNDDKEFKSGLCLINDSTVTRVETTSNTYWIVRIGN